MSFLIRMHNNKNQNNQIFSMEDADRQRMIEETSKGPDAEVLYERTEIERYRAIWDRLSGCSDEPVVCLEEYFSIVSNNNKARPFVVILKKQGQVTLICPFQLLKSRKKFTIGKRKLFSLRVRKLQLVGRNFIGNQCSNDVRKIFELLAQHREFDLVTTGEIELDGKFFKNLKSALANSGWRCVPAGHKDSIHWLIDLNSTFDEYLAGFSRKTRSTLKRKIRKFDAHFDGTFRVISKASEIDEFLEAGEKISRLTYQWDVGQRFNNDEATRRSLKSLAQEGQLRGYLLYARGVPCAFMRGSIKDGIYDYGTPGFDPELKQFSPGTVLLLKALEDLIVNTNCKVFDFGTGGDLVGYKKMFGNRSYEASSFEIGRTWRPYTLLLFGIQGVFYGLKQISISILSEKQKSSIKRMLKNS